MTPHSLDQKLDAYAEQPLPPAPAHLGAGVWREIDRRRHEGFAARIGWHDLLARPAWVAAALALAVVVGAVPALVLVRTQEAKRFAQESLRFDAFSTDVVSALSAPEPINLSSP